MSENNLLKTPLYDLHLELGAKMVPFAGYDMPVQYPLGVLKEHNHTREQAGLFDVSHMGQVRVKGEGIAAALEKLVPVELGKLPIFKQTYALFTTADGGISDDLIITRWAEDEFFLVVNAACKDQDIAYLRANLEGFELEVIEDHALLALQGPSARAVLDELIPSTAELRFMSSTWGEVNIAGESVKCFVTCSGYPGEDGYEVSIPASHATAFAKQLLAFDQVEAIGLGARDSLRLEVGLCLYGHDLDNNTSPIEAGLLWSISKSRRAGGEKEGGFPGAEHILNQIAEGTPRKRVGLKINGRAPVREGAELVDSEGNNIGKVTSGGFGPTAGAPVAMGYVSIEHATIGSQIGVVLRGKTKDVEVVKMPFVPQNYVR